MIERPRNPSTSNAPDDDGNSGSAAVISMSAAAISGFLVGLLVRGEIGTVAISIALVGSCAYAGWWARGIAR